MSIFYLIFYSLFLILFTLYTVADSKQQIDTDIKQVIKPLEQLNQLESTPKECQHCLNFSESDPQVESVSDSQTESTPDQEDEDLLQQCAIELCGPANENPTYVFDYAGFDEIEIDPEMIKSFNEEALPAIEAAIKARLDYDKYRLDIL